MELAEYIELERKRADLVDQMITLGNMGFASPVQIAELLEINNQCSTFLNVYAADVIGQMEKH